MAEVYYQHGATRGVPVKIIAAIEEPSVTSQILNHLGELKAQQAALALWIIDLLACLSFACQALFLDGRRGRQHQPLQSVSLP